MTSDHAVKIGLEMLRVNLNLLAAGMQKFSEATLSASAAMEKLAADVKAQRDKLEGNH